VPHAWLEGVAWSCTVLRLFLFFFFSSRRRHTRSLRDWSSDVCSSDLGVAWPATGVAATSQAVVGRPLSAEARYAVDEALYEASATTAAVQKADDERLKSARRLVESLRLQM